MARQAILFHGRMLPHEGASLFRMAFVAKLVHIIRLDHLRPEPTVLIMTLGAFHEPLFKGWWDCLFCCARISLWQVLQSMGDCAFRFIFVPEWIVWQLSQEMPFTLCLLIFQKGTALESWWQERHLDDFSSHRFA